jgi:hypothetical protein
MQRLPSLHPLALALLLGLAARDLKDHAGNRPGVLEQAARRARWRGTIVSG